MYKSIIKIIAIALIIGLNWSGILAVGETIAYFNDVETSNNNIYSAATLDFSLPPTQDFSPNLTLTQTTSTRTINVNNQGVMGFEYNAKVANAVGDLCAYLEIKDDLSDTFQSLVGYASATTAFSDKSNWVFASGSPNFDSSLYGKVCDFDLVFDGSQIGGSGFSDIETISNRVEAASVVLNEFLPNADDYFEFIEIYNMTGSSVDLTGFYVETNGDRIDIDSDTTDNIYNSNPGSTTIPAPPNGWLVIIAGGNLMNDSAGTITLYNPNDVVVDTYDYAGPEHNVNNSPGDTNNLVGYWSFDGNDEAKRMLDLSGNGNNGTNNGSILAAGKINDARGFDGIDDYVEISDSDSFHTISDEITIETWVKVNSNKNYNSIIVKDADGAEDFELLCNAGGDCYTTFDGISSRFYKLVDTNLQPNEWTHLVITYKNGGDWVFYKNGFPIDTTIGGQALKIDMDVALWIGDEIGTTGRQFDGVIDEVKIYNRALDVDEVLEHFEDTGVSCGDVPVDKSYARIPDGIGNWVDPIPTPGGFNKLEQQVYGFSAPVSAPVPTPVPELASEPEPALPADVSAEASDEGAKEEVLAEEGVEEPVVEESADEQETTTEESATDDEEQPATEESPADEVSSDEETVDEEELATEETTTEETAGEEETTTEETTTEETTTDEGETTIEETTAEDETGTETETETETEDGIETEAETETGTETEDGTETETEAEIDETKTDEPTDEEPVEESADEE